MINFFFTQKTLRVLTWRARILVMMMAVLILWLSRPLFIRAVTEFIVDTNPPAKAEHLVVENWGQEVNAYAVAMEVGRRYGTEELASVVFEDEWNDPRGKIFFKLASWTAGIDTTKLIFIPVPQKDPKTLNIAQTVMDTAFSKGWMTVTLLTPELHSSRSRKAYERAAKKYGITVNVVGLVYNNISRDNWSQTSIGLSSAFSECLKKLYYEIFVF